MKINIPNSVLKRINIYFDYSTARGSTEQHNKFKKEFMICCSYQFPDITVIPYDVGFVRAYNQPEICYRVGQEGVPDTIVFGKDFYLFFDMKTGKNRLQENQIDFKNRIKDINKGIDRVFKLTSVIQGLEVISVNY